MCVAVFVRVGVGRCWGEKCEEKRRPKWTDASQNDIYQSGKPYAVAARHTVTTLDEPKQRSAHSEVSGCVAGARGGFIQINRRIKAVLTGSGGNGKPLLL